MIPTVNEELDPPVTADCSAFRNWGTEDRLRQLNRLSNLMPEPTDVTCWKSGVDKWLGRPVFGSGRFSMFDAYGQRGARPTRVPLVERNQLFRGL